MRVSVIALPLVAVSAVATQHVPRSQHLKRVQALQERQDILDVLDPLSLFSRTSTQVSTRQRRDGDRSDSGISLLPRRPSPHRAHR